MENSVENIFYTYVLYSKKFNRMYIGHSNNIERRIKEHNSGKTKSTKAYIPWKLVHKEMHKTRKEAVTREKYLKSGIGRELLKNKVMPR